MKLVLAVVLALVLGLGGALALLLVRRGAPASANPLGQGAEPAAPAQERLSTDLAGELAALEARLERVAEEVARLREEVQRASAPPDASVQEIAPSTERFLQEHRAAIQQVIEEDRDRLWLEERIRAEAQAARYCLSEERRLRRVRLSDSDIDAALEILERWQRRNLALHRECPPAAYTDGDPRRPACLETLIGLREGRRAEVLAALGEPLGEELLKWVARWDPQSVTRQY